MIDRATGTLSIENCPLVVGPELTRGEFLASSLGDDAQPVIEHEEWSSFQASIFIAHEPFVLTLYFKGQTLAEAHLCLKTGESGWNSWSEDVETRRKALHDEYLSQWFGSPPYQYRWGEVVSVYDERSGASEIIARYVSRQGVCDGA